MHRIAAGIAVVAFMITVLVGASAVKLSLFTTPEVIAGPNGITLAEELGYPRDARLLVINSDDTAGHPSFTDGLIKVMALGVVRSTSVIVNDRNDLDLLRVADLAREHPQLGVGIHLSLTNEYQKTNPWSPVLSKAEVPSLYNSEGLAWEKISEVEKYADPAEVKKEFRAQIHKAMGVGIDITHIDSHMGTYYRDSQYPGAQTNGLRQAAIAIAKEFDLPITMNTFDSAAASDIAYLDSLGVLRPDTFFGFYELEDINDGVGYQSRSIRGWIIAIVANLVFGLDVPYTNQSIHDRDLPMRLDLYLDALTGVTRPGLNHFFIHAALEDDVSGSVIPEGKNHAQGMDRIVRLGDTAVFSDPAILDHMKKNQLYIVNYKSVRAVQRRWRSQEPSELTKSDDR